MRCETDGVTAMAHKTVFLDRDGVINKVVFRDGKPVGPRLVSEFEIETGVDESLARLRAAGFKLFIVTNQPDVARGLLTQAALDIMTGKIMAQLAVDAVRVCPHDDRDRCSCRKPGPGMLLDLAREHDLDLTESWFIGDSWKDTMAGRAVGCETIILDRPYNQDAPADRRVGDLRQAVELILEGVAE